MAPVAPVRFRVAALFLFFVGFVCGVWTDVPSVSGAIASIAQLAEHALSKRKVTSSILVGGLFVWSSLVMTLA